MKIAYQGNVWLVEEFKRGKRRSGKQRQSGGRLRTRKRGMGEDEEEGRINGGDGVISGETAGKRRKRRH